jgi:chromosome partitioning protein
MKTIAIISQKGGAGKTTIALHLAVAAERRAVAVAVLDLDPQASAAEWKDSRPGDSPSVTSIQASRLRRALDVAASAGAGLVIIDSAPHSADAAVAAAEVADAILIPCRAGILDLRAIATTARIVRATGKPAYVVLKAAPVRAPLMMADAAAAVAHHGLVVAPVILHQRSAYAHALAAGQTAEEYEPDGKAAEEVADLFGWLADLLKLPAIQQSSNRSNRSNRSNEDLL